MYTGLRRTCLRWDVVKLRMEVSGRYAGRPEVYVDVSTLKNFSRPKTFRLKLGRPNLSLYMIKFIVVNKHLCCPAFPTLTYLHFYGRTLVDRAVRLRTMTSSELLLRSVLFLRVAAVVHELDLEFD